jgi:hypothetical protein
LQRPAAVGFRVLSVARSAKIATIQALDTTMLGKLEARSLKLVFGRSVANLGWHLFDLPHIITGVLFRDGC